MQDARFVTQAPDAPPLPAASWLRPFRGRLDFSTEKWRLFGSVSGDEKARAQILSALEWLQARGWLLPEALEKQYAVHPQLFLLLPVNAGAGLL